MEIGSVVNLKSGGAFMTVVAIEDGLYTCVWTDDSAVPHEVSLPVECIEPQQLQDTE